MVDATVGRSPQPKRSKRPNFSVEFKRQIVEATLKPGASAALIARKHDINANLLFKWRRHYLAGDFGIRHAASNVMQPCHPRSHGIRGGPAPIRSPRSGRAKSFHCCATHPT
nr:transposase [Paraburkholderia susongensis]